jgi:hypothetical protein
MNIQVALDTRKRKKKGDVADSSKESKRKRKMGMIKYEDMDNKKEFLGGLTQKEFYERLHFLREHGGHK